MSTGACTCTVLLSAIIKKHYIHVHVHVHVTNPIIIINMNMNTSWLSL